MTVTTADDPCQKVGNNRPAGASGCACGRVGAVGAGRAGLLPLPCGCRCGAYLALIMAIMYAVKTCTDKTRVFTRGRYRHRQSPTVAGPSMTARKQQLKVVCQMLSHCTETMSRPLTQDATVGVGLRPTVLRNPVCCSQITAFRAVCPDRASAVGFGASRRVLCVRPSLRAACFPTYLDRAAAATRQGHGAGRCHGRRGAGADWP